MHSPRHLQRSRASTSVTRHGEGSAGVLRRSRTGISVNAGGGNHADADLGAPDNDEIAPDWRESGRSLTGMTNWTGTAISHGGDVNSEPG